MFLKGAGFFAKGKRSDGPEVALASTEDAYPTCGLEGLEI